jgi:uncharacterized repeat protein (TIGR03943 family)
VTAAGGTITVLIGAVLLRLTLGDTYQRYVREGMGTWLLVAGVALVALGAVTLVRALRHSDHDHEHGVGVGWLLLAPIAALLLVAPPTLGSYGVGRGARVDVRSGPALFAKLDRGAPALPMTLLEFGQRAFEHRGRSFNGASVQLVGFAAGTQGNGFRLARYQIACCAADAIPVVVEVDGSVGALPSKDQWFQVTGTFKGVDGDVPRLAATSLVAIAAPVDPYE